MKRFLLCAVLVLFASGLLAGERISNTSRAADKQTKSDVETLKAQQITKAESTNLMAQIDAEIAAIDAATTVGNLRSASKDLAKTMKDLIRAIRKDAQ